MRRAARVLLAFLAVVVAASVLVASAAAATTYQLVGIETAATSTSATFQGTLVGQLGLWQATITHDQLDKSPHGVTAITGGSFTIAPAGETQTGGTIDNGGGLVAEPAVGGHLCTQQFLASGTLTTAAGTGSFQGTLTHYGTRLHGACEASFASFVGSVTIP